MPPLSLLNKGKRLPCMVVGALAALARLWRPDELPDKGPHAAFVHCTDQQIGAILLILGRRHRRFGVRLVGKKRVAHFDDVLLDCGQEVGHRVATARRVRHFARARRLSDDSPVDTEHLFERKEVPEQRGAGFEDAHDLRIRRVLHQDGWVDVLMCDIVRRGREGPLQGVRELVDSLNRAGKVRSR